MSRKFLYFLTKKKEHPLIGKGFSTKKKFSAIISELLDFVAESRSNFSYFKIHKRTSKLPKPLR